jgi:hypothetical protein
MDMSLSTKGPPSGSFVSNGRAEIAAESEIRLTQAGSSGRLEHELQLLVRLATGAVPDSWPDQLSVCTAARVQVTTPAIGHAFSTLNRCCSHIGRRPPAATRMGASVPFHNPARLGGRARVMLRQGK